MSPWGWSPIRCRRSSYTPPAEVTTREPPQFMYYTPKGSRLLYIWTQSVHLLFFDCFDVSEYIKGTKGPNKMSKVQSDLTVGCISVKVLELGPTCFHEWTKGCRWNNPLFVLSHEMNDGMTHPSTLELHLCDVPRFFSLGVKQHVLVALQEGFGTLH